MEKMISELNGKLKTLRFRINKTVEIIDKHDKEASERHQASIANITSAVNTLKESIEEKNFSKGETEEQVTEWGADAESMRAEADECTRKIAKQIKHMNLAAQDADALQAHHKAIELEKQLTEQKLQQRGRSSGKSTCRTVGV